MMLRNISKISRALNILVFNILTVGGLVLLQIGASAHISRLSKDNLTEFMLQQESIVDLDVYQENDRYYNNIRTWLVFASMIAISAMVYIQRRAVTSDISKIKAFLKYNHANGAPVPERYIETPDLQSIASSINKTAECRRLEFERLTESKEELLSTIRRLKDAESHFSNALHCVALPIACFYALGEEEVVASNAMFEKVFEKVTEPKTFKRVLGLTDKEARTLLAEMRKSWDSSNFYKYGVTLDESGHLTEADIIDLAVRAVFTTQLFLNFEGVDVPMTIYFSPRYDHQAALISFWATFVKDEWEA